MWCDEKGFQVWMNFITIPVFSAFLLFSGIKRLRYSEARLTSWSTFSAYFPSLKRRETHTYTIAFHQERPLLFLTLKHKFSNRRIHGLSESCANSCLNTRHLYHGAGMQQPYPFKSVRYVIFTVQLWRLY